MFTNRFPFRRITVAAAWLLLATVQVLAADHPLKISGADNTRVGIYIYSLTGDSVVASVNADRMYIPASVMKSVTAATVITEMMPDGRFSTTVDMVGSLDNDSILNGNVVVNAIGDPTIESQHFTSSCGFATNIAKALKERGVTRITGTVIIDETRFPDATVPTGWMESDLKYSYGAYPRGANYRGNAVGKSSMGNPALTMANDIVKAIQAAGIRVDGGKVKPKNGTALTIFTHTSPRVDQILHSLMVRSDNMWAEAMLRVLEPESPRQSALDYETALWGERGLDMRGIKIYDGSGLSRSDRLSPQWLASLYRWMWDDNSVRIAYSDLFPRAGREGTMRNFLKGTRLEGRLAMKTGSMTGVQCYGGYLLNDHGVPTHIVVVMINDFTCDRAALKKAIASYLLDTLP